MKKISVAIDGPSGAGKSTLAKAAAQTLHFRYLDTGALYRTIALAVLERHLIPQDAEQVAAILPDLRIGVQFDDGGLQHMLLNGRDVTEEIRMPEVSMYASAVAAHPAVRAYLLDTQRVFARENHVIVDGRDIGTEVLPQADVKVFLTASPEVRAQRRCKELSERGTPKPYQEVLEEIQRRDWDDTHRTQAPLRQAPDAVLLDTSELDFQESLEALLALIRKGAAL